MDLTLSKHIDCSSTLYQSALQIEAELLDDSTYRKCWDSGQLLKTRAPSNIFPKLFAPFSQEFGYLKAVAGAIAAASKLDDAGACMFDQPRVNYLTDEELKKLGMERFGSQVWTSQSSDAAAITKVIFFLVWSYHSCDVGIVTCLN